MTVTSNITNAQLAAQIQALIQSWQTRENQMIAWLAGAVGGGDYSNGTYPLSDAFGNVKYIESPAQMESDITNVVDSATTQATAAATAATAASAAQTAAITARNLASTYATNAANSATQAGNSQSAAASSAASALASKNAAAASSSAAAASASSMTTSVTDSASSATAAATSASNAASSASAAAASATAAATFNPALYATLSGATFSGSVAFSSNTIPSITGANGSGIYLNFTDGQMYFDSQSGLNFRTTGGVTQGRIDTNGSYWATGEIVTSGYLYTNNGSLKAVVVDANDGWLRLNSGGNFTNGIYSGGNFRVDGLLYTNVGGENAFLHHASGHTSGNIYVSSSAPSGGNDGDIWIQI